MRLKTCIHIRNNMHIRVIYTGCFVNVLSYSETTYDMNIQFVIHVQVPGGTISVLSVIRINSTPSPSHPYFKIINEIPPLVILQMKGCKKCNILAENRNWATGFFTDINIKLHCSFNFLRFIRISNSDYYLTVL